MKRIADSYLMCVIIKGIDSFLNLFIKCLTRLGYVKTHRFYFHFKPLHTNVLRGK